MNKNTEFSGEPETKWRTDENQPDRDMELLENFYFIDPDGKQWNADKGEIIDGASIPRFLWTYVGSPYTRDYRRASIVHDVAVRGLGDTPERKKADMMFYHACIVGGCSKFESWVLYLGVRIGSWTSENDEDEYDEFEYLVRHPRGMTNNTNQIRNEFIEMVETLRGYDDKKPFIDIDRLIEGFRMKLASHGYLK